MVFEEDLIGKEGVLVVETLKNSSVCSWMNFRAICWGLWLKKMV